MKEPLWDDPDPQTPGGRDLWDRLVNEGYTRANFDASEARDVGQRICRVEAEATAAAEQRLRTALEVVLNHLNRAAQDVHYDEGHQPTGWQGCSTERCREVRDDMAHARAALDTPPPASPRQGEPVDVERLARLRRDFVAVAEQRNEAQAELLRLRRLIVSYADLTHRVVQEGGDWREITAEWSIVVAEARAALSEPAEAGEL